MISRCAIFLSVLFLFVSCLKAEPFLIENGVPKATIIISKTPERMQRLAAGEFRMQIEKISGARLPISTQPPTDGVKIYIGASEHNPVDIAGLEAGAYRIKTGPDWIAFIGDDTDFVPPEPFAKNNGDIPRATAEWHKIVGAPYGMPSRGLYKNRLRLPATTGRPDGEIPEKNERFDIWGLDERGSFNAVCGYLRKLGARWYLPGELGEVLPEMTSIPLPKIDETVIPDFPLRQFNFRFSNSGYDTSMWAMHLGIRNDNTYQVAHGMAGMTNNEAVFEKHPEWFALYGGKRDFRPGHSKCQLCYSDEGLFTETVSYVRTMLDNYPFKSVSVMPPDGYTAICQCDKCKGKDSPERHERGRLSNHVWGFVNRVAKEVAKTHPDAKVLNAAYGVYTLPPDNIEKLEPNVLVCIVGGRRPINKAGIKGEGEAAPARLREGWSKMTDNPIIFFENYPFTDRGWYLPTFAPKSLIDTVNATKGISMGEDIWLSAGRNFDTNGIGFNHFLVYFTARNYWTGKEGGQGMFDEYCRLFYGPAEREMHTFFTYCEENWKDMETDQETTRSALDLFEKAKAKVDPSGIYGKRIALIDEYLKGLRMKSTQLSQKRGPVPSVRLIGAAEDIVIDGKFDETYWQKCPVSATGRLYELETGQRPTFETTFKSGWQGTNLYFAIRCNEKPGEPPVDTATQEDDTALWKGDAIELQIATETHSYYQIAISPDGDVVDLDRGTEKRGTLRWSSKAEVATQIEDDHWNLEIRIPVTSDENDPFHQVIGRKPIQSLPWHINICRQRIRDNGQEHSALSPTGTRSFHEPMKFAHFYDGRSHKFEADPEVTDFVIEFRKASRTRKAEDFLALAEMEKITDLQKSTALEMAALYSRDKAGPIVEKIPLEPVRKAAQMQFLLIQRKAPELIDLFGEEDFSTWPFWKRGDGYRLRGRAWFITKNGERAEADLSAALSWLSEAKVRDSVLLTLGQNRENILGNDEKALEAYDTIIAGDERIGSSDQLGALQGLARIYTRRGDYAKALETLNRANPEKLQGTWKKNIEKSIKAVNEAKRAAL
ncbi:MAG: DUF4838 domain-containing protein [Verrucomicrobiales bacterium]|nr:DUF4838 domain-containing protein [Verrucomicrobiales bacterium]